MDNDDIIHLRDFACSAFTTLFNEMSGAYMVSRQDGSERQSAMRPLILDWYFPDSLIDTSNNRISLNILFDDDCITAMLSIQRRHHGKEATARTMV